MYTELINLKEWKTKKQILNELRTHEIYMDERAWRVYVENHNKRYFNGLCDDYIVHGKKGYKLTQDRKEIVKSADDLTKRALNMLWKASQTYKSMGEHMNIKLDEFLEVRTNGE